jgi:DNA-binding NarL/FixJ family response regulator
MTRFSIAITEDNEQIRQYMVEQIRLHLDTVRVEEFADGETALRVLTAAPVEIALFDIQLPGISGIDCMQQLKSIHPRMQMMALTIYDDAETIFNALKAGASSYILKNTPPEKIIEAIRELYEGGSPISSQIARKVIEAFQVKEKVNAHFQALSRREQEILEQLSRGFLYKEIADKLFITIDTVRTHIRHIYEKLQVNSRVDALKKTGLL